MKKTYLLPPILFLCLLPGCKKCNPVYVQAPPPPVVIEPALSVEGLKSDSTMIEVVQCYKMDLAEWVAYARKLEVLIWGKPTEPKQPTS